MSWYPDDDGRSWAYINGETVFAIDHEEIMEIEKAAASGANTDSGRC